MVLCGYRVRSAPCPPGHPLELRPCPRAIEEFGQAPRALDIEALHAGTGASAHVGYVGMAADRRGRPQRGRLVPPRIAPGVVERLSRD